MNVTRQSIINWIKMTEVRDCAKLIDGIKCPCADKLRRMYVTRPRESELRFQRRIEIVEKEYQKCYNN